MRYLAILTVRNEGAFLLEWLAHHRAVGFTDFLVFSNDCDDGTDAMLDRLESLGQLAHLRNAPPYEGGVQFAALKRAEKHPLVQDADWIAVIDIDEFVNVHVGEHTLGALLGALPDATAITLTWRLFGNAGVVHYQDLPVTEQFTQAAPRIMGWPWRAALFKTLYRNDGIYRKPGVHRPRSPDKARLDQTRWFDGSGRELDGAFRTQRIFSQFGRDNYRLVQLNHYPLGAMESYLLKRDRGRVNRTVADSGMSYWVERNWSDDEDRSVLALKPEREAQKDALMTDKILADLHAAAVAWRHQRFEKLMTTEPMRALFGRLLMAPPSRQLDPEQVKFLYRFAQVANPTAD